jgi:hypothetical protein
MLRKHELEAAYWSDWKPQLVKDLSSTRLMPQPMGRRLEQACASARAARDETLKVRVQDRGIESKGAWLRLQHDLPISINQINSIRPTRVGSLR